MDSRRRTVITGIGLITPMGLNTSSTWERLRSGRSGIGAITAFDASNLPTRIAGEVKDFDAKSYIPKHDRKCLKVMERGLQLGVCAAQLAMDDGRVDKDLLDPQRFGLEFGLSPLTADPHDYQAAAVVSLNGARDCVDMKKWPELGIHTIPPMWLLKFMPNMLACHVSVLHNAQGPSNTHLQGEVSSLLALGETRRIIVRDQADILLVGGADQKIHPVTMARQGLFANLSRCNDVPEQACRPFDRRRDGQVLGEGGAALVVEELEHARRRGAAIYAELTGYAAGFDTDHSGRAMVQAMRSALSQAEITPDDLDHVNAHGLGSPAADAREAQALHKVLGPQERVAVFAGKSYFGNLGAAGGVTELAASLLALKEGMLPATLNYQEPDPACPVRVNRLPRPVTKRHVLKLGFTDKGHCAALVVRKWEE